MDPPAADLHLRPLLAGDWGAVRAIYLEGIGTGEATFETEAPAWERWDADHLAAGRLVAERGGQVVGWAALSRVSGRCVYAGVAEVSVYVARAARGSGVGRRLLAALVETSEAAGFWTLQAGVFTSNAPSLALHRACGFRVVGVRERLGARQGAWRDVALLERRSPTVGGSSARSGEAAPPFHALGEVRAAIDGVDARLVGLLAERGRLVEAAAAFERDEAAVRAPARLEAVVARARALAAGLGAEPGVVEAVYRAMIAAFIELELARQRQGGGQG